MNELILVVDDEPKIVKLAQDYLEQSGFKVLPAYDGKSAIAMTRQERPDLVVLDLNLPGMDGIDVCRVLRRDSDVPIIMLTARDGEADRLHGAVEEDVAGISAAQAIDLERLIEVEMAVAEE